MSGQCRLLTGHFMGVNQEGYNNGVVEIGHLLAQCWQDRVWW